MFLFNPFPLHIPNSPYVIANSLYILSFNHKIMNKLGIILTAIALLSAIALVIQLSEPISAHQQEQSTPFVVQSTKQSMQDPLPGHESHQVVIAAPLRDD